MFLFHGAGGGGGGGEGDGPEQVIFIFYYYYYFYIIFYILFIIFYFYFFRTFGKFRSGIRPPTGPYQEEGEGLPSPSYSISEGSIFVAVVLVPSHFFWFSQ